jgi:predicted DNA-binding ribbon-helix-helix protein
VLCKHSVEINGRQSSVSLEPEFWDALRAAAQAEGVTVSHLVSAIDRSKHRRKNLTSEIRVRLLSHAGRIELAS